MAELLFRQGELSQLFDANGNANGFVEGSLNFTTDEPAIYFDVNGQRQRIGDIREFDSIAAIQGYLKDTQGQIPSSGLYYAKAENVLMKFDKNAAGTAEDPKWKQINLTTAERANITSAIATLQGAVGTAQGKANSAYELAEAADANANKRVLATDFETFKTANTGVINGVKETAEQGVNDAAEALRVANAAGTAAGTAQGTADAAQGRADAAYALAEEGKGIASKAILKDGTVSMENNLNVGNHKIINLSDPDVNTDAANKKYVDEAISKLSGTQEGNINGLRELVVLRDGTAPLTGNWNINTLSPTYTITGLPNPANDSDAVNKSYVDNKFKVADAMQFKGVVESADDLLDDALNIEAGWTYKVGKVFSFGSGTSATKVYVGDLLIANADASDSVVYSKAEIGSAGATWSHVSSGYESKNASYLSYEEEKDPDTKEIVAKTLYLDDIQDGRRGSVTFMDDGNVKSNVTVVEGESVITGVASHINVGFKLEWGTFGSTSN